jgi:hypothetical protein
MLSSPVSLAYASPRPLKLRVFALQLLETKMPLNYGPSEGEHKIAYCFHSAFNANFLAGMLCGFFSVKRKFIRLSSHFHLRDFHCSGVKPESGTSDFSKRDMAAIVGVNSQKRNEGRIGEMSVFLFSYVAFIEGNDDNATCDMKSIESPSISSLSKTLSISLSALHKSISLKNESPLTFLT